MTETLTNSTNEPVTVTYTFTSPATACYAGLDESISVVVNPIPSFTNLPSTATIASGTTLDFQPESSVVGAEFSWTSTAVGDIVGNSASGSGKITDSIQEELLLEP